MEKIPLTERKYLATFVFVTSLFMLWGIAISMGDVLNRHFQKVLNVSLAESGLVQFSIFGAYAVMGIPAGIFIRKFSYKNGVLFGLSLYAIGAFLFIPAAGAESFGFFRLALFVLACGLATLETVAHPFTAALGDERKSEQRINLKEKASSFIVMGVVGGALFPWLMGQVADTVDVASAYLLPIICYVVILLFAVKFWKPVKNDLFKMKQP